MRCSVKIWDGFRLARMVWKRTSMTRSRCRWESFQPGRNCWGYSGFYRPAGDSCWNRNLLHCSPRAIGCARNGIPPRSPGLRWPPIYGITAFPRGIFPSCCIKECTNGRWRTACAISMWPWKNDSGGRLSLPGIPMKQSGRSQHFRQLAQSRWRRSWIGKTSALRADGSDPRF